MALRKAFRYRIYPSPEQMQALAVQFGHARFVYNWGLATRQAHYRDKGDGISYYTLKRMMTELKRCPEYSWLKDADSQVLQAKIEDLNKAFVSFFEKRSRYPRFKKRSDDQSIRYPQRFKFDSRRIYLPKVGWVKAVFHRPLIGKQKSVTVSKTKSGEYYVSVLCESEPSVQPSEKPPVGVDLGLACFATLSTGEKVPHPAFFRKSEKRLRKLNRRLSRKVLGSKNREKARLALARHCRNTARRRVDFLHKLSRRITSSHGTIKLESLNIVGMLKVRRFSKRVSDSGWAMFVRFCKYKAKWSGSVVEQADPFYPSSKTCSNCGKINRSLKMRDRSWVCDECGARHDRDENAAINLLKAPTLGARESLRLQRGRKSALPSDRTHASLKQEAQDPSEIGQLTRAAIGRSGCAG